MAALITAFALLTATLHAQVPQIINYQGRVAVGTVNFDGSGSFKFALVNADGTTTYWSNDGTSAAGSQPTAAVTLTVTKGLYSVLLGDTALAGMTAIPNSVFANSDVRLRVWFNDGTNDSQLLTPDQRIAAVGYAMAASTVGGVSAADVASGANLANAATTASAPNTIVKRDASGNIPGVTPASTPPPGMVLIPAGAFTMGNSVAADTDITDAAPVSTTVSAFYMSVNEVTQNQWDLVYVWAIDNGYTFTNSAAGKGANHPVQMVSWYDCVKWCNARSEQAGKTPVYYTNDAQTTIYKTGNVNVTNAQVKWSANGYRLPTEAEWEKASRGGLSGQRFPWGRLIKGSIANYFGFTIISYDLGPNGLNLNGSIGGTEPATCPVGSFEPNGYGLYDMAGNVSEWCWDSYQTPYDGGTDPKGAAFDSFRVFRGGSWGNSPDNCRSARRVADEPGNAGLSVVGFRVVLSLPQP